MFAIERVFGVFVCVIVVLLFLKVSLCVPDCPENHYVDKVGLTSQGRVQRLKVCTSMHIESL